MRWAWILVVVACAPARPEKLERPRPIRHVPAPGTPGKVAASHPTLLVPRPEIDLPGATPDFHDELRWPLTPMNHPSLEPRFPIAQAFAQPGVGWLELCGLGVQNRFGGDKELLSYLRGWCSAINGDIDEACRNLVPLFQSGVRGLEPAVRTDLANILANEGHADKAEHYINIHNIWDVGTLDVLAANYVEVGTTEDAVTINRHAIDSDDHASAATKCMRWTKQIVLLDDRQSPLLKQIEAYATQPRFPDATCVREHHKLRCWAGNDCVPFMQDVGITKPQLDLIDAYRRWILARTAYDWNTIASTAIRVGIESNPWLRFTVTSMVSRNPVVNAGFAPLAIAAMENWVAEDARCLAYTQWTVHAYVPVLRAVAQGEWATRLDALAAKCEGH